MSRRKKVKIKKDTVYNFFSFFSFVGAVLLLLSLTGRGPIFGLVNKYGHDYAGPFYFTVAFPLIFCGLLISRLKFKWNQPGLFLGSFFIWSSLAILFQQGIIGKVGWDKLMYWVEIEGIAWATLGLTLLLGLVLFFQFSFADLVFVIVQLITGFLKVVKAALRSLFAKRKLKINDSKTLKIKNFAESTKVLPLEKSLKTHNHNTSEEIDNKINEAIVRSDRTRSDNEEKVSGSGFSSSGLGQRIGDLKINIPQKTSLDFVWQPPPLSLLSDIGGKKADRGDVKFNASIIERTLKSFGIVAQVMEVNYAPAVTQYALEIAEGTKVSKITSLSNDLALALAAPTGQIRIEAPIPGKKLVGIEVPNKGLEFVTLKTMLTSGVMKNNKSKLAVALGIDVSGNPIIGDLSKMPHALIAGSTGSGKSVCINTIIASLLFRASPEEVRMILVDPKRVELSQYNDIPHLLTPVIVENKQILSALHWATKEMDERYKKLAGVGVKNIDGYNEEAGFQAMPYVVIIIDELADIMMFAPVEVEDLICRIAQMARAVGIHLVLSTQRPSVNVITGLIKANIPTRIAFNVASMIDSRVILDSPGAEKLLGRGDMLFIPPDQNKPTRVQGAFVSEAEIKNLVAFLKSKNPVVNYTKEIISTELPRYKMGIGGTRMIDNGRDELFAEVARIIIGAPQASVSAIQRKFSLGFARAARIMDQLEAAGVVGPGEKSKPREVLVQSPEELEKMLNPEIEEK